MNIPRALLRGLPVAALLALGACATPLEFGDPVSADQVLYATPELPAHQAVQDVLLAIRGHEVQLVCHVNIARPPGALRAHLGTDMGMTGLDIEVSGGEPNSAITVHAKSAMADFPRFDEETAENLVRAFGVRSIFAASRDGAHHVPGSPPGDAPPRIALPLADGSWIVGSPASLVFFAPKLRLTLLDADRVPEARLVYDDIDEFGVYRLITIEDLRDRYRLEIDVAEVILVIDTTP